MPGHFFLEHDSTTGAMVVRTGGLHPALRRYKDEKRQLLILGHPIAQGRRDDAAFISELWSKVMEWSITRHEGDKCPKCGGPLLGGQCEAELTNQEKMQDWLEEQSLKVVKGEYV